jgi:aminoglycoside phosphotransferase (APT) family kinase protein
VIHGDWKLGNLGLTDGGPARHTVLLDWAQVGIAPPAVDLGWYLAVNSARIPVTREATIDTFLRCLRDALGDRFAQAWWEPQLDLALLGAFVQLGWPKILGALRGDPGVREREQDEVRWWSERVLRGARRLDL